MCSYCEAWFLLFLTVFIGIQTVFLCFLTVFDRFLAAKMLIFANIPSARAYWTAYNLFTKVHFQKELRACVLVRKPY